MGAKALKFLRKRDDLAEVYYYWRLAGGSAELSTTYYLGLMDSSKDGDRHGPAILRLPLYLASRSNGGGGFTHEEIRASISRLSKHKQM